MGQRVISWTGQSGPDRQRTKNQKHHRCKEPALSSYRVIPAAGRATAPPGGFSTGQERGQPGQRVVNWASEWSTGPASGQLDQLVDKGTALEGCGSPL
jgi:hypothetical protein